MSTVLGSHNKNEDEFFVGLCNNISNSVTVHFQSILSLLNFNDALMGHKIPTSVQLNFSLKSSEIQRTFMFVRSQIEELVRLTKLYSTSWEEKNQCIKALHQQYNIKQRRLDIALKKIEILSGRNKALEKLRVQVNWERMFLKLNQHETSTLGWRHVVREYKENMACGRNIGYLFSGIDGVKDLPKYKVVMERINAREKSQLDSDIVRGTPISCDSRLDRFSTDDEDELRFSSQYQEEEKEDLNDSSINDWITNSHSESFHVSYRNVECQHNPDTKEVNLQTENSTTYDKASSTRVLKYKNTLNLAIRVPDNILAVSTDCCCTVALNNQIQKKSVSDLNNNQFSFQFNFGFEEDFVFSSVEFLNTTLRIGFHREEKEPMIAFTQSPLSDLRMPCIRENDAVITSDNEIILRATVDDYGFKFNQPCGEVTLICYIYQTPLPFQMDQSTETLSLNEIVEELLHVQKRAQLERCKSACVETDEKPVYTENDLESVRDELTRKLQELKDKYEEGIETVLFDHAVTSSKATSPIFHPSTNHHVKVESPKADKYVPKENRKKRRLKCSEQWGKNLPSSFLTRLDMFQDASEQYHKELKTKTTELQQTALHKKLSAEKKLWYDNQQTYSVFSRDVYLPAVFMPIKSKQQQPISGRSFLTQPIKNIQLPFLNDDNQKEHEALKHIIDAQE